MRVLLEARAGERLARVAVPRYKQPQTAPRRDPTVNPFDLFNPSTMPDPSQLTGMAGANTLLEAARHFPGGPTMLVFVLFWSPGGTRDSRRRAARASRAAASGVHVPALHGVGRPRRRRVPS